MFLWAFLTFCPFEVSNIAKCFTFTDICLRNFVRPLVLSKLFSHFGEPTSVQLVQVAYETAFGSEVLMNRFSIVCSYSVAARKNSGKDCYFDEICYGYVVGQRRQGNTGTLIVRKTGQIDELNAKLHCNNSYGERDMSSWRTPTFKDIFTAVNLSKQRNTSFDVGNLFCNELER